MPQNATPNKCQMCKYSTACQHICQNQQKGVKISTDLKSVNAILHFYALI